MTFQELKELLVDLDNDDPVLDQAVPVLVDGEFHDITLCLTYDNKALFIPTFTVDKE